MQFKHFGEHFWPAVLDWGTLLHFFQLCHMEQTCYPNIKATLKDLFGIEAHSYQGRERNYQGPQLRKILAGLDKLVPSMQGHPRNLYLAAMVAMSKVNKGVFGLVLDPAWREILEEFKAALDSLSTSTGFPLTPKQAGQLWLRYQKM